MKNFFTLFIIIFVGLALSTYGLLISNSSMLSAGNPDLSTSLVVGGEDVVISLEKGRVAQGKQLYQQLGCVSCHTQQNRRPGFGGDYARGWGDRQNVARDYVLQDTVHLGSNRTGPDLANVGSRMDETELLLQLYQPASKDAWSSMPSFTYLFEERAIQGSGSSHALSLEGNVAPNEGFEVVPTTRANALVSYLQSLKIDFDLPEAKRVKK